MQGKYRIYISYAIVVLIGIFVYVFVIAFIEKKDIKEIAEITPVHSFPPLNKELEEPIKIIDDIQAIEHNKEDLGEIYQVVADVLNIREEPNTESRVIKKYINGDNIQIINTSGKWGELKSGGFAYMELLKINEDKDAKLASDEGIATYIIKVRDINIREAPNTQSKIIRQMTQNERLLIKNIQGQWGEVIGGGFAYMELLAKE